MAPFLTNLEWLPDKGRLETREEYHNRVFTDLVECKRQFALHGLPVPKFFAYPFSAHEGDPEGTKLLRTMVTSQYRAAMLDDAEAIATSSSSDVMAGLIQRMDVTARTGTDLLVDKMLQASPIDPSNARPFEDVTGWFDASENAAPVDTTDGRLEIKPDPGEEVTRDYAPIGSTMWNNYTIELDVSGFVPDDGSMGGISVLKPSQQPYEKNQPHQVDVTLHGNSFSIDAGADASAPAQPLVEATKHHVVIDVRPSQVDVSIDGSPPTELHIVTPRPRTAAGGFSLWAYRQSETSPPLVFSNLTVHGPRE
jgi:biofilm PGA synthesis lipoprotein PgaB